MIISRRTLITGIGGLAAFPTTVLAANRPPTPQETMGPFYPVQHPNEQDADLTRFGGRRERAAGAVIELFGHIFRRDGSPVPNAEIVIWQANAAGRYRHSADLNTAAAVDPNFQGYAKLRTGSDGAYRILTVKPGAYPVPNGTIRAPHIHFDVSAVATRVVTQMYFPGEALNETDFLRSTLSHRRIDPALVTCAHVDPREPGLAAFRWDVVLLEAA